MARSVAASDWNLLISAESVAAKILATRKVIESDWFFFRPRSGGPPLDQLRFLAFAIGRRG